MSTHMTTTDSAPAGSASVPRPAATERSIALDAFRGFIMFTLASHGFGFNALQGDPTYGRIAAWFEHVDWTGGVFWDMIQPSFMFMAGMALPYALAARTARGATPRDNFKHVGGRALKLLLLSNFLTIASDQVFQFQLINVLAQLAFTYFLTYLIIQMEFRWQVVAAAGLLIFHSALFFVFPGPAGPFSREGNVGQHIDKFILGRNYPEGYLTINFISSTVTTLFGAWAGMLMRTSRPVAEKLRILAISAVAALLSGLALSPIIPNVKHIWTASWTLYSTGWVLLMLLAFVVLIDVAGYKRAGFPLLVVGMNSIFIYACGFLIRGSVDHMVRSFTGGYQFIGALAPVAQQCTIMLVLWYLCYWLYKHKIFIKL